MNHFGPFMGREISVDMNKTAAASLENRNDLATVIDLELGHQFPVSGDFQLIQQKVIGVAARLNDGLKDLFAQAALFPLEPIVAGEKYAQGRAACHQGREEKKQDIALL